MKKGGRFIDETNNVHNWLKVLEFAYSKKNVIYWKCECKCGKRKTVSGRDLRSGHTKSCGCYWYSDEVQQKISRKGFKHSEETKRKMSEDRKGVSKSKKHRESIGKAHEGNNYGIVGEKHHMYNKSKSEEQKKKISETLKGKYCCEDNPNWNLNLTEEERENKRHIPGYKEWREAVYERDNYTCQICGDDKGGNLNAHHIESYAVNPDSRITVGNGVTLCESCHKNFHHQYTYYDNTMKQWEEFLNENST